MLKKESGTNKGKKGESDYNNEIVFDYEKGPD